MSHQSSLAYRPEIDGLRALAVVPVVLFHAGLSGFSGGYVGVDIFFVISGFLITGTLIKDLERGEFSILSFYERRVRRIAPALLTVLAATIVAGLVLLDPGSLSDLAKSVFATLIFASNILFFRQSGYFDLSSEFKPLLHTWSLSVEEQFYIVFPIVLALLAARSRKSLAWVLSGAAIASFLLSIWASREAATFGFFLPFTRAWELLAGALLALFGRNALPLRWQREVGSALGLGLILYAILRFDHVTLFPGMAAGVPVLGAIALIAAGGGSLVGTIMASRVPVAIGLISYSFYLWHWPVLVFMRFYALGPLSLMQALAAVLLSALLAIITTRCIEVPTRRRALVSTKRLVAACAAAAAILIALSLGTIMAKGFPGRGRAPQPELTAVAAQSERFQADPCLARDGDLPPAGRCMLGASTAQPPRAMLWGDSHAAQIAAAVDAAGKDAGLSFIRYTKAGCTPVQAERFLPNNGFHKDCSEFNGKVLAALRADPSILTLILAARWEDVATGKTRVSRSGSDDQLAVSRASVAASLRSVADLMEERGGRLVVVGQVPLPPMSPPHCLRIADAGDRDPSPCARFSDRRPRQIDTLIDRSLFASLQGSQATLISPVQYLCDDGGCNAVRGGKLMFMDSDHLTSDGAMALYPAVLGAISRNHGSEGGRSER